MVSLYDEMVSQHQGMVSWNSMMVPGGVVGDRDGSDGEGYEHDDGGVVSACKGPRQLSPSITLQFHSN